MTALKTRIKEVAFYLYQVKDITTSLPFYEKVLGLPVAVNYENRWVEFDINGQTLALFPEEDKDEESSGGSLWLEVEDIDAFMEHLKAHNVPIKTELMDTPVCRMAVFADPSGNSIGIHQAKPSH